MHRIVFYCRKETAFRLLNSNAKLCFAKLSNSDDFLIIAKILSKVQNLEQPQSKLIFRENISTLVEKTIFNITASFEQLASYSQLDKCGA